MPENNNVINMATGKKVIYFCHICGFDIEDREKGCPNAVNHPVHQELPPLGVCVSDTSGVVGKVGN